MDRLRGGASFVRSDFIKNVFIVASGSVVAQAIPVVMTPVLTRLYPASTFGTLGLYVSFITVMATTISLGYSQAIVSGEDECEATRLTVLSMALSLPASFLGSLAFGLLILSDRLGYGALPLWAIPGMLVSLFLTGVFFSIRYWAVRNEDYRVVSRATMLQSTARVSTQVVGGLLGAGSSGLILGEIIGRFFGLNGLWHQAKTDILRAAQSIDLRWMSHLAGKYKRFPLLTVPAALLDSLGPAVHVPLISSIYGVAAAGQYSIANTVLVLPVLLIGTSVADVFHSRLASLQRSRPEQTFQFILMVSAGLFALALVPASVLALAGETVSTRLFGSDWQLAGALIAVMAPRLVTLLVVNPISRVVLVFQGQGFKLIYNGATLLTIIALYYFASSLGWDLVQAMRFYTIVQIGMHCVYFSVLMLIVRLGRPSE